MLLVLGTTVWAQTNNVRKNVRQGNRQYSKEKYDEAETRYRKALSYDSTYYKSQYNLGNAMYRQKMALSVKSWSYKAPEGQDRQRLPQGRKRTSEVQSLR